MDLVLFLGGIFFLIGGFSAGIYYANIDDREQYHFLLRIITLMKKPDKYELIDIEHKIKDKINITTNKKNKHFQIALVTMITGIFLYAMRFLVLIYAGF